MDHAMQQQQQQQMMAVAGPQELHLGQIVQFVIQSTVLELRKLQYELTSQNDIRRKERLSSFLHRTRHRMLELIVLVEWASKHLHILQNNTAVLEYLRTRGACFNSVLGALQRGTLILHTARAPLYDVSTALDIRFSGTYLRLPEYIASLAEAQEDDSSMAFETMTKEQTLTKLNSLVLDRLLNASSFLPPNTFARVHVCRGRLECISRVGGFRVLLRLADASVDSPWRVLAVQFHIAEDPNISNRSVEDIPKAVVPGFSDAHTCSKCATTRETTETESGEQQHKQQQREKQSRNGTGRNTMKSERVTLVNQFQADYLLQLVQQRLLSSDRPLADTFALVHSFASAVSLELLTIQAKALAAGSRLGRLYVEEPGYQSRHHRRRGGRAGGGSSGGGGRDGGGGGGGDTNTDGGSDRGGSVTGSRGSHAGSVYGGSTHTRSKPASSSQSSAPATSAQAQSPSCLSLHMWPVESSARSGRSGTVKSNAQVVVSVRVKDRQQHENNSRRSTGEYEALDVSIEPFPVLVAAAASAASTVDDSNSTSVVWLLNAKINEASRSTPADLKNNMNNNSGTTEVEHSQRCMVTICDANSTSPMTSASSAPLRQHAMTTSANFGLLPSHLNVELLLSRVSSLMAHERLLQLRAGLQCALVCDADAINSVARVIAPVSCVSSMSIAAAAGSGDGSISTTTTSTTMPKLVLELPAMCVLVVKINLGSGMLALSVCASYEVDNDVDREEKEEVEDGDVVVTGQTYICDSTSKRRRRKKKEGSGLYSSQWGGRHDERTFLDGAEETLKHAIATDPNAWTVISQQQQRKQSNEMNIGGDFPDATTSSSINSNSLGNTLLSIWIELHELVELASLERAGQSLGLSTRRVSPAAVEVTPLPTALSSTTTTTTSAAAGRPYSSAPNRTGSGRSVGGSSGVGGSVRFSDTVTTGGKGGGRGRGGVGGKQGTTNAGGGRGGSVRGGRRGSSDGGGSSGVGRSPAVTNSFSTSNISVGNVTNPNRTSLVKREGGVAVSSGTGATGNDDGKRAKLSSSARTSSLRQPMTYNNSNNRNNSANSNSARLPSSYSRAGEGRALYVLCGDVCTQSNHNSSAAATTTWSASSTDCYLRITCRGISLSEQRTRLGGEPAVHISNTNNRTNTNNSNNSQQRSAASDPATAAAKVIPQTTTALLSDSFGETSTVALRRLFGSLSCSVHFGTDVVLDTQAVLKGSPIHIDLPPTFRALLSTDTTSCVSAATRSAVVADVATGNTTIDSNDTEMDIVVDARGSGDITIPSSSSSGVQNASIVTRKRIGIVGSLHRNKMKNKREKIHQHQQQRSLHTTTSNAISTASMFESGTRQLVDALHTRANGVFRQVRLDMCKARLQSMGFHSYTHTISTQQHDQHLIHTNTTSTPISTNNSLSSSSTATAQPGLLMPPPPRQTPEHRVPWVGEALGNSEALTFRMAVSKTDNRLAYHVLCALQGLVLPPRSLNINTAYKNISSNNSSGVQHATLPTEGMGESRVLPHRMCVSVTLCSTGTLHVAAERVSSSVRNAAVAIGALGFKPLFSSRTPTPPTPTPTTAPISSAYPVASTAAPSSATTATGANVLVCPYCTVEHAAHANIEKHNASFAVPRNEVVTCQPPSPDAVVFCYRPTDSLCSHANQRQHATSGRGNNSKNCNTSRSSRGRSLSFAAPVLPTANPRSATATTANVSNRSTGVNNKVKKEQESTAHNSGGINNTNLNVHVKQEINSSINSGRMSASARISSSVSTSTSTSAGTSTSTGISTTSSPMKGRSGPLTASSSTNITPLPSRSGSFLFSKPITSAPGILMSDAQFSSVGRNDQTLLTLSTWAHDCVRTARLALFASAVRSLCDDSGHVLSANVSTACAELTVEECTLERVVVAFALEAGPSPRKVWRLQVSCNNLQGGEEQDSSTSKEEDTGMLDLQVFPSIGSTLCDPFVRALDIRFFIHAALKDTVLAARGILRCLGNLLPCVDAIRTLTEVQPNVIANSTLFTSFAEAAKVQAATTATVVQGTVQGVSANGGGMGGKSSQKAVGLKKGFGGKKGLSAQIIAQKAAAEKEAAGVKLVALSCSATRFLLGEENWVDVRYEKTGVLIENAGGAHAQMWEKTERAVREILASANPSLNLKSGRGLLLRVPNELLVSVLRVAFGSLCMAKQSSQTAAAS